MRSGQRRLDLFMLCRQYSSYLFCFGHGGQNSRASKILATQNIILASMNTFWPRMAKLIFIFGHPLIFAALQVGKLARLPPITSMQLPPADAGLYRRLLPVYRQLPPAIWTLGICCIIPLAGHEVLNQTMDIEKNWILKNLIKIALAFPCVFADVMHLKQNLDYRN